MQNSKVCVALNYTRLSVWRLTPEKSSYLISIRDLKFKSLIFSWGFTSKMQIQFSCYQSTLDWEKLEIFARCLYANHFGPQFSHLMASASLLFSASISICKAVELMSRNDWQLVMSTGLDGDWGKWFLCSHVQLAFWGHRLKTAMLNWTFELFNGSHWTTLE